jgi:hypothetical protein
VFETDSHQADQAHAHLKSQIAGGNAYQQVTDTTEEAATNLPNRVVANMPANRVEAGEDERAIIAIALLEDRKSK